MRLLEEDLHKVRKFIYDKEGIDINLLKKGLVERKLIRRMKIVGVEDIEGYITLLNNEMERRELINSFLIGVTSFVRNYEVYECFAKKVIKEIFKGLEENEMVNIMSMGSSTGEEVYSIVFTLIHFYGERIMSKICVYGVDMNRDSVNIAREGIYSRKDVEVLPEEWIKRFFIKKGDRYSIIDDLKKICKFYCINVLKDKLPIESCSTVFLRNFLIFFSNTGKNVVLEKVDSVLKRDGFIILGKAETGFNLRELKHNYTSYCPEHRIFRKGGVR